MQKICRFVLLEPNAVHIHIVQFGTTDNGYYWTAAPLAIAKEEKEYSSGKLGVLSQSIRSPLSEKKTLSTLHPFLNQSLCPSIPNRFPGARDLCKWVYNGAWIGPTPCVILDVTSHATQEPLKPSTSRPPGPALIVWLGTVLQKGRPIRYAESALHTVNGKLSQ